MRVFWGVDSSVQVTESIYECVVKNLGKPQFWGRYLTNVPGSAEGLKREEISFLHKKGIRIIPIYNNFKFTAGFQQGKITAINASFQAKRLRIPVGTVLFSNIEKFHTVNEAWIRGYVGSCVSSGYRPGFYCDPVHGEFSSAFCAAEKKDPSIFKHSVLWSAQPEFGITTEALAPAFRPAKPPCKANVWGWQYGRDAQICPIDTNLVDQKLYMHLWK